MKVIEYLEKVWIKVDNNPNYSIPCLCYNKDKYMELGEWLYAFYSINILSCTIHNYATGRKVCAKLKSKEVDITKLFHINKDIRIGVYSDADCEPALYVTIPVDEE